MADIAIGTQYEINKQGFQTGMVKPMRALETITALNGAGKWAIEQLAGKYFMLLCREAYDFTVFNNVNGDAVLLAEEIQEVLESRGEIVHIEYNKEQGAYEIWIKCNSWMKMRTDSEYVMFLFFPCDTWAIEV